MNKIYTIFILYWMWLLTIYRSTEYCHKCHKLKSSMHNSYLFRCQPILRYIMTEYNLDIFLSEYSISMFHALIFQRLKSCYRWICRKQQGIPLMQLLIISLLSVFINTQTPRPYRRTFADEIFKGVFLNENCYILIILSLKFIHRFQHCFRWWLG